MKQEMKKDWDTQEQCDLFDEYLAETADINDRVKVRKSYGYSESEWEAFQYGWNAAKKHFGVEEIEDQQYEVEDCPTCGAEWSGTSCGANHCGWITGGEE